jgi:hypothetical protein
VGAGKPQCKLFTNMAWCIVAILLFLKASLLDPQKEAKGLGWPLLCRPLTQISTSFGVDTWWTGERDTISSFLSLSHLQHFTTMDRNSILLLVNLLENGAQSL